VPRDRTEAARRVVAAHLLPGERIETALPGIFADSPTRRNVLRQLEMFLGLPLGRRRALVLTNRRLLVLPLRARDRPGEGWFVVQLDARRVRATGTTTRGGLRLVPLRTGVGDRLLLLATALDERGSVLARLLGAPAELDPRPS